MNRNAPYLGFCDAYPVDEWQQECRRLGIDPTDLAPVYESEISGREVKARFQVRARDPIFYLVASK